MTDCGAQIHPTLKRCPWTLITYDQHVSDKYTRTSIPSDGIPTLLMMYVTLSSSIPSGDDTKLQWAHTEIVWISFV